MGGLLCLDFLRVVKSKVVNSLEKRELGKNRKNGTKV